MAPTLPLRKRVENPVITRLSQVAQDVRVGRSVSIDQAAQLLGVSRRTIYYRIREGRLQTIRTLGSSQRVLVESLHRARPLSSARPATVRTLGNSSSRNA